MGPPTTVNCTLDGSSMDLDQISRSIVDGPMSVARVEVTLITRAAGTYECTVSNARVDDGTLNNITASNSSLQINVSGN